MKLFERTRAPAIDLAPQSALKGLFARLSPWSKPRREAQAEETFSSADCAIWNDVVRALEAKPKSVK